MRLLTAILAAAAAVAAAAPTVEAPAFGHFRALCLEHRSRPRDALGQAAATGWMPAPRSMVPPMPRDFTDGAVRWRSTAQAAYFLAAGHGRRTVGQQVTTLDYCAIIQLGTDARFAQGVEAWVDLPATETEADGTKVFVFTEQDGRHTAIAQSDDPAYRRALEGRQISVVAIHSDGDTVVAAYMTPSLGQTARSAGSEASRS